MSVTKQTKKILTWSIFAIPIVQDFFAVIAVISLTGLLGSHLPYTINHSESPGYFRSLHNKKKLDKFQLCSNPAIWPSLMIKFIQYGIYAEFGWVWYKANFKKNVFKGVKTQANVKGIFYKIMLVQLSLSLLNTKHAKQIQLQIQQTHRLWQNT